MRVDFLLDTFSESTHYVTEYHADAPAIGQQMTALGIDTVMLPHLIPATNLPGGDGSEADLRRADYCGNIVVCDDLDKAVLA